jgi:uncharacterized protein YbaR (Trm112 family)
MPIEPDLLALLACPSDDHAPLRYEQDGGAEAGVEAGVEALVCTYCGSRFRIDDGIPVLLLDEATPGPHGLGVAAG